MVLLRSVAREWLNEWCQVAWRKRQIGVQCTRRVENPQTHCTCKQTEFSLFISLSLSMCYLKREMWTRGVWTGNLKWKTQYGKIQKDWPGYPTWVWVFPVENGYASRCRLPRQIMLERERGRVAALIKLLWEREYVQNPLYYRFRSVCMHMQLVVVVSALD